MKSAKAARMIGLATIRRSKNKSPRILDYQRSGA